MLLNTYWVLPMYVMLGDSVQPEVNGTLKWLVVTMKAVIFMVIFYDRGRIQIRVSQGKRCRESGASNYPLPLESWTDFPVPAMTCDNLHRALPTREARQASPSRVLTGHQSCRHG